MRPATSSTPDLLNLIAGSWTSDVLDVALALDIPELLAGGPRTISELSATTGCHGPSLARFLKALATIDICVEGEDGSFACTPMGSRLRTDVPDSLYHWTMYWNRVMRPLWAHLGEGVKTGASVRKAVTGYEGFERQQHDPAAAAMFNRTMAELTRLVADDLAHTYDFSGVEHIVDVGGGYGELLVAILGRAPHVAATLFDLPHAIEGARQRIAAADLTARCQCVAGDFFESVPPDADLYLLKSIIHDWSDDRAAVILNNCRHAMHRSGRIVLVERISPARVDTSDTHRQMVRSDLAMMLGLGSQERTQTEFGTILGISGFTLTRTESLALAFSVIEAVPTFS